jgi:hypothetical protein
VHAPGRRPPALASGRAGFCATAAAAASHRRSASRAGSHPRAQPAILPPFLPSPLGGVSAILDLLENCGAELPEIKTWTLAFDRKTNAAELTGRLSEESVRKILSAAKAKSTAPPETRPPAPENDILNASQAYFRSVASLIEGLKGTERPTYRSTKLWYDRYAKQIEELPLLNVDLELLDWGAQAARTLREMGTGVNYYAQSQKYTVASTPGSVYAGYDYSKAYDASAIKKQSDAMMSVDLDRRWQALESSIADLRRKMVAKYKVDF